MVTATIIFTVVAGLALSWAVKAIGRAVAKLLAPVDVEGAPSQLAR